LNILPCDPRDGLKGALRRETVEHRWAIKAFNDKHPAGHSCSSCANLRKVGPTQILVKFAHQK
jgi:hypothetical protein